jgi:hypothetical protein
MGNYTLDTNKPEQNGLISAKEVREIFKRTSKLVDFKAHFFVKILIDKHGWGTRELGRATGFSAMTISNLYNYKPEDL